MKVSVQKGKESFLLKVVFGKPEIDYLMTGIRSEPKLIYSGTVGNGLIFWFDEHRGLALRRDANLLSPSMESVINARAVHARIERTPVVSPGYSKHTEEGRPAIRLNGLKELAPPPFNPALSTERLPPQEDLSADRLSPQEEIQEAEEMAVPEPVAVESDASVAERLFPPAPRGNRPRYDYADRVAAFKASQSEPTRSEAPATPTPPPERAPVSPPPPAAPKAEARPETKMPALVLPKGLDDNKLSQIRAAIEMLNESMEGIDPTSLVLRVENNRVKARKIRIIEEPI